AEAVPPRDRLLEEAVDRGPGDPPLPECLLERILIDDPAAGRVDQVGVRLHQGELAGTDEVARLVPEWAVDRNEVRRPQELVQAYGPDPQRRRGLRADERIVRHGRLHAEALQELDQGPADASEPDHAEPPVAELAPHEPAALVPAPLAEQAVLGQDLV